MKIKVLKPGSICHGVVCFTFDDARYRQWLPLMETFAAFHAHATFFFHGEIDAEAIKAMRQLQQFGHSVGLHSVSHADADTGFAKIGAEAYFAGEIAPQLEACRQAGIEVRNFAYPNNRHTAETDRFLMARGGFRRFRCGLAANPPKGFAIAAQPDAFLPLDAIKNAAVLGGCGIGEYYAATQENLNAALTHCAETNTLLTLFSHGISETPGMVDMHTHTLEQCLAEAARQGIAMAGFDELP